IKQALRSGAAWQPSGEGLGSYGSKPEAEWLEPGATRRVGTAKHRPWRLWASRDGVDATTWPDPCQALSTGREKSRPGRGASRCLSQRLIRRPFRPKPSQDSIASELTRKTFMMSSKTSGDGMALPLENSLLAD